MKVKDLYERMKMAMESGHAEDEVVLPVVLKEATFGPSPCVKIKDMAFGFDWDNKKVFLYPEKKVTPHEGS